MAVDDWKTEACPHHGPSLAIAADGTYHVAWFTNGRARRGLFFASSSDGGRTFSPPQVVGRPGASHPYLLKLGDAVWLAWKEFDGETTTVFAKISHNNGRTWSEPQSLARTTDSSDLPLLVTNGRAIFLSWQTQAERYRLIPVEAGL